MGNKLEIGLEQGSDYEYHGAKIGKWTYFGDDIIHAIENGHIQNIGRYPSIHHSAIVQVNHQFRQGKKKSDFLAGG